MQALQESSMLLLALCLMKIVVRAHAAACSLSFENVGVAWGRGYSLSIVGRGGGCGGRKAYRLTDSFYLQEGKNITDGSNNILREGAVSHPMVQIFQNIFYS